MLRIYNLLFLTIITSITLLSQHVQKSRFDEWSNSAPLLKEHGTDLDSTECSSIVLHYDLGKLVTKNQAWLGFIGDNYQRFDIYFSSMRKDRKNAHIYHVIGKTLVKNIVCKFDGTMKVLSARLFHDPDECENNVHPKVQGIILFKYIFKENPKQKHSGLFEGYAVTQWYLDSLGGIQYDNLWECSDGFCNNSFVGTWKSYLKNELKTCNWGEYRIPFSGDLDNGAGEFYPDSKYFKFGWDTYGSKDTTNWWK
jgi:hypothetical protein